MSYTYRPYTRKRFPKPQHDRTPPPNSYEWCLIRGIVDDDDLDGDGLAATGREIEGSDRLHRDEEIVPGDMLDE